MKYLLIILITVGANPIATRACDLCGCYTPQLEAMHEMPPISSPFWISGIYGAVAEQFTDFGTLQMDGAEVKNPTGQYLDSSITQLVAGYGINSRLAVQIGIPIIYRDFKRPEGFAIDHGTVSGLGDMSLLLRTVVFQYASENRKTFDVQGKNPIAIESDPDFTASFVCLTGIKFPTGDSSRLEEEFHETELPNAPVNAIHGHDLTLGTGSYDGIFGEQSSLRYRNLFFETNLQFTLRGDGTHQYHFANDLTWSSGPGYYFVRRADVIIGAQFVVSGEYKDVDRFRGYKAEDTGITSVFVGPRLIASYHRYSADVSAELPVLINNTALQAVPDYRLRAGISFHF
jgi:hypothetical protein